MTDSSLPGHHEVLLEEIDALKAIYVSELNVENLDSLDKETTITVHLYPATADKAEEQYVKLTLVLRLPQVYPDEIPAITVQNPRGLSDEDLLRITCTLKDAAESKKGCPMLYELIELVKDFLTAGNRPYGICCICLSGFHSEDVYMKTSCFHHFHSHCLARYVTNQRADETRQDADVEDEDKMQTVTCPVCREMITCDLVTLSKADEPVDSRKNSEIKISEELREVQAKMKELLNKQRSKGGIIDVEAEKKKYHLEISLIPDVQTRNAESTSADKKPSARKSTRQDRNTQNLSAKKPTNPNSEGQTQESKRPEQGRPRNAPRQQRHPDSQGPRRPVQDHDNPDERWRPQGGNPERGRRFDEGRPRGAPSRRRWQGPPPPSASGRGQPPAIREDQQRQPSNRSRYRPGGFTGRNFFRSPNVIPAVKMDTVSVAKGAMEEVGTPRVGVDVVRQQPQPLTEARSSAPAGFATKSNCNMWTISGPPPGFRMKPAFPSRSAAVAPTSSNTAFGPTPVIIDNAAAHECRD